ncbi:MAG: hypothetical protein Q8K74_12825 [Candidatus Nitrotoga sp.]|nr:hypothetical protein [Candidatus Nitrotoga sp.]MDO9446975.1 hypothetical protein [Candidatus Nitrotoga sp.]MDP1637619.1 hypothetical protein [Candidatus Nitrotoga sp.]MDP1856897.1 hypothetical protein [Candidatus Nitrotoga sp.]MDP3496695.1 hypothetical protein [Candidatus Nitrotoga sp.]
MLIIRRHWACKPKELIEHALSTAWILDIDTTVKILFGHQSDAEASYNPLMPECHSRTAHTYWCGNPRLLLQTHVQSGKSHSATSSLPGLIEVVGHLPKEQWPQLVRGDCGFGNEVVIRRT